MLRWPMSSMPSPTTVLSKGVRVAGRDQDHEAGQGIAFGRRDLLDLFIAHLDEVLRVREQEEFPPTA